ncbi:EamA family transporter [Salinicoccus sp. ID82-1]|uniref:EamA family transporter n=1 Tax=Salinicoccus cyprini TaxID=2493691 RepID=A0A558AWT6_9STAP|nr:MULTISPECIES: DMT family transporter [Salinicoccus]MCG1010114.1 EamA family transporter [Salinicoccus sp. ID82-1]TVT28725.1 EamA family transporter [Salinicoccus cyprini]
MISESKHIRGLIFVLIGATLWGVGGTAADYIFRNTPITVEWYVAFRLTASGIILLAAYWLFSRKQQPVRLDRRTFAMLVIYSLLGMTMVQYSFMAAIGHGNAAIATVLQYTGPIYIILWLVIRRYAKWSAADAFIIIGMIAGVILLATNGDFSTLIVSPPALIWGLVSGVALAYYTLHAQILLYRLHPLQLVGGSMFIGGIAMNFIHPIWQFDREFEWTAALVTILLLSVLIGTTLAFLLYISSLKHISSKEAGILGTLEPVSAVVSSVIWLDISMGLYQFAGIAIILGIAVYISVGRRAKTNKEAVPSTQES